MLYKRQEWVMREDGVMMAEQYIPVSCGTCIYYKRTVMVDFCDIHDIESCSGSSIEMACEDWQSKGGISGVI